MKIYVGMMVLFFASTAFAASVNENNAISQAKKLYEATAESSLKCTIYDARLEGITWTVDVFDKCIDRDVIPRVATIKVDTQTAIAKKVTEPAYGY